MEELTRFRQLGSKTPGHPEHGHTEGVETTTGPLGQGVGNAVGMAMAQRMSAAHFNQEGFPLFDYRIWTFASDGDLMEGIASEAASLAGHLKLGNLKVFYDDNQISIDGPTSLSFSEDVCARFAAYGWRVLRVEDGNDLEALEAAFAEAEAESERPMLVAVRTVIGYGSPGKQGTAEAHGSPLGKEERAAAKRALGWPEEPTFRVPDEARAPFAAAQARGAELEEAWNGLRERYAAAHPELAADLDRRLKGELPAGWQEGLPNFTPADGSMATRAASGKVLAGIASRLPHLVGGSADLTPSNNTSVKGRADFSAAHAEGLYLRFGVREHAMGAILNGITLSGLWLPYGGTFLIFSDYMRPAIRLAALSKLHVVYVFTHDSIFLGEDGPTHQPISQLASLRSIPGMTVIRPADACETAAAWRVAVEHREGPVALALTRQGLPVLQETSERAREGVGHGAYVVFDVAGKYPDLLILATGSEVHLAVEAAKVLAATTEVVARVVSMPSWELFDRQPQEYRDKVLAPSIRRRLAVEAASPFGWHKYVGFEGRVLGMEGYGASAPAKDLALHFGFTVDEVVKQARAMVAGK